MRKPLEIPALSAAEAEALDTLYRTTRVVRLRTRAQIVLLAGEQRLTAPAIARIVREDEETVRRWLKRWLAEGIAGLSDRPMPGGPAKITDAYRERLLAVVRQRPRSLGQPYSLWTLQRLADYLAEVTGLRLSYETVRVALKAGGIALSRPQHTVTSPDPEYQLKKLGRQTWLEELILQMSEIGRRIAAEAELGAPGLMAIGELAAQRAPGVAVVGPEVLGGERAQAGGHGGDQAHGAPHDRAGRGALAAGGAALVVAGGPEELLQRVVGAGQVGHLVALEQAGPVAGGHLQEVGDRRREGTGGLSLMDHLRQQATIGSPQLLDAQAVGIAQQMGRAMHPRIGRPDLGPERGGGRETASEQAVQAG